MAEQQGQIFKVVESGAEPESIDVRRLPHLISGASVSKGSDRTALALEINKVLIQMRKPGHEEAESRILVAALDEHRLDDLVDDKGRACRKEAVETLLACGFPHALNVSPDDLVFARSYQPNIEADATTSAEAALAKDARRRGLGLTIGSQALLASAFLFSPGPAVWIAVLAGLVAIGASWFYAASEPDPENNAVYGLVIGILALIQGACMLSLGLPALFGGLGIIAGLLVSLSTPRAPSDDSD